MVNPYQAPQSLIVPTRMRPVPRTAARRLIDAALIWLGVLFGAHGGVAVIDGLQAAANRGLSSPVGTLYFFAPVGICVIATVACWSFVRFRGSNAYQLIWGIRFPGGITIGCITFLIASWLNPNHIIVPVAILVMTTMVYVELEALLCRSLSAPKPSGSELSENHAIGIGVASRRTPPTPPYVRDRIRRFISCQNRLRVFHLFAAHLFVSPS